MNWWPPQHGKSELISRNFPAWYLGENPDDRFIEVCYGADFAAKWSKRARDKFNDWAYKIWGLRLQPDSKDKKHWDILDHDGGMHSGGIDSGVTGERGDFINVDDPHRNRKEAKSPVIQLNTYEFYTDVLIPRLSKKGLMNITQTRWDVRDLSGRILFDKDGNINEPHIYFDQELHDFLLNGGSIDKDTWVILRMPAIAEENDILGRRPGEALCEDLHPLRDLLANKKRMLGRFDAQYQGLPVPEDGEMFERSFFEIIPKTHPLLQNLVETVAGVDLAGTRLKRGQNENQGPAKTAYIKASKTKTGDFVVHKCKDYRDKPGAIRTTIKAQSFKDNNKKWNEKPCNVKLRIVHDPGQAAIDQMERYEETFKGTGINFKPFREKDIGSKEDRAQNVADHGEIYKIYLVQGDWNADFIQEHIDFPNGRFKDKVDATSVTYSVLYKIKERYPDDMDPFKLF